MNKQLLSEFKESFRGPIVEPGDTDFDDVRALYNGMIDKRPLVIARCTDVADVVRAVAYGRDSQLPVAVRGGGHNGPGLGSCDDGLTIDNLLEADVVLADGSIVTASADENEDLFWGLRGGGGNFGIVTSFLFQAHPVSMVYAGPIFWDVEHAGEILRWYRDFQPTTPRELCTFLGLKRIPTSEPFPEELWGRPVCALISCYVGSESEGMAALKRVREELPTPCLDGMGEMPFPAVQGMFDPLMPKGMQWYWKGDFVRELSDEAIEAHVAHGSKVPEGLSLMHLYPIDGVVHEVASDATAWSCRDAMWSMVIAGVHADPAEAGTITRWARDYWEAVHDFNPGGAYVNFMMADEGEARVEATYGPNFARLKKVKAKYDPENFFRINQNIRPA